MIPPDRTLLASWFRAIPQSRHEPIPLAGLPGGEVMGWGLALLLETWGAVELTGAGIRAVSQPAYYFLHSLAAWAETEGGVITDWSEEFGVDGARGLQHGASLVYLLEQERLARNREAPAIRFTPVAQVLIIQPGDPPRFLTQWDEQAGFYQVIGGRQKRNQGYEEPIQETAIREMREELGYQLDHAAGDFDVELLVQFDGDTRLSPTFGALTTYRFTFFRAANIATFDLAPTDLWVTRQDLISGKTIDGHPVRGDHISLLERRLGQRIDNLPSSFVKIND